MSTLQRWFGKVERILSDFVETDGGARDPGIVRLEREEADALGRLRSVTLARSSRSFLTCASVVGLGLFAGIGYLTEWAAPALILMTVASVATVLNGAAARRLGGDVALIEEQHDRLVTALESRKARRRALESSERQRDLILALDTLDDAVAGRSAESTRIRSRIRERVLALKRDRVMPLCEARERMASFLVSRDVQGLEAEIHQIMQRQAEREADGDLEGSRILERSLSAKRETAERLAEAERELTTIDLLVESVEIQVEHLRTVAAAGDPPDADEIESLFGQLEDGLLYAPGAPERLPGGSTPELPPS